MKNTPMSANMLNGLQQQVEKLIENAVGQWQFMPHTQFSHQPAPNAWSANQCLQHLNQYGRYYLPAIQKALNNARPDPRAAAKAYHNGWLGGYFVKMMQPTNGGQPTKKMKAMKGYDQYDNRPSHEVIAEFIDQLETLLSLLEKAKLYNNGTIRISTSLTPLIRLKLGDTFQFLVAHIERHCLQAERALNLAITPAPSPFV